MQTYIVWALLVGVAVSATNLPEDYWKNLAHGVNARSLFQPGVLKPWWHQGAHQACSLPQFTVPFSGMANYGPAGMSPYDGTIAVGLLCVDGNVTLPFLWVIRGDHSELIKIVEEPCMAGSPQGDVFEGNLNYLPDGGAIFGLCKSIYVLPPKSNTLRNLGPQSLNAAILTVVNSSPVQLFISGWNINSWGWGAAAYNIDGMDSHSIVLQNPVTTDDTTIMFSTDGKTMYNGHFTGQSPGGQYGLQYYKTPFTAATQPFQTVSWCGQSRPWTYSTDSAGNYYSSWCQSQFLVKIGPDGEQVWNVTCPAQYCPSSNYQQFFMTDDEKYIYFGNTASSYYSPDIYYVVDAETGDIKHSLNFTKIFGSVCARTFGPFALRWPLPLVGKTRAVLQCEQGPTKTQIYSVDPFAPNYGVKQYTAIAAFLPIMLTDSSDNIYALGVSNGVPSVYRIPA